MVTCPDICAQVTVALLPRCSGQRGRRTHTGRMLSLYPRARRPGRDDAIGKVPGETNRIPGDREGSRHGREKSVREHRNWRALFWEHWSEAPLKTG